MRRQLRNQRHGAVHPGNNGLVRGQQVALKQGGEPAQRIGRNRRSTIHNKHPNLLHLFALPPYPARLEKGEKHMAAVTEGGLLGNRLRYKQLASGHRSGFEPILLAACVPAQPGEKVLEAGTGAGAALLCLAARVPGVHGIGVERAADLAALANENFKNNGFSELSAVQGDTTALPFASQSFHHVLANPPWFNAAGTASPDTARDLAHRAAPGLLEGWITELGRVVRPKGSISLILPAASFATATAALRAQKCGTITLLPLWPRAGQAAKMVILTARKASRAADKVLPGLILHDEFGITASAQAVLRDGAALP